MSNSDHTKQVLGFTGNQQDPVTGAYPLGNGYRFYVLSLMRFGAPDSWSPFGAGGINPYAYCAADPINHSDPSGHISLGTFRRVQTIVRRTEKKIEETIQKDAAIAAKEAAVPFHQTRIRSGPYRKMLNETKDADAIIESGGGGKPNKKNKTLRFSNSVTHGDALTKVDRSPVSQNGDEISYWDPDGPPSIGRELSRTEDFVLEAQAQTYRLLNVSKSAPTDALDWPKPRRQVYDSSIIRTWNLARELTQQATEELNKVRKKVLDIDDDEAWDWVNRLLRIHSGTGKAWEEARALFFKDN